MDEQRKTGEKIWHQQYMPLNANNHKQREIIGKSLTIKLLVQSN